MLALEVLVGASLNPGEIQVICFPQLPVFMLSQANLTWE